jgi:hypothetical protein
MGRTAIVLGYLLVLGTPACDSDIACPGHIDPRSPASAIIRVVDGAATIAAVAVVAGPCTANLDRYSSVDAMTTASVSVSLRSDAGTGCLIEVFSDDGRCEAVTVTIATYASSPQYHCVDNSNCCGKSAVVAVTLGPYSTIAPYETDVSFRENPCPGYDGGTAGVDGRALDAGAGDGGAIDRAID